MKNWTILFMNFRVKSPDVTLQCLTRSSSSLLGIMRVIATALLVKRRRHDRRQTLEWVYYNGYNNNNNMIAGDEWVVGLAERLPNLKF